MNGPKWYWIRRDDNGCVTAAVVESSTDQLVADLKSMAEIGPVERVFLSNVVVGRCLTERVRRVID